LIYVKLRSAMARFLVNVRVDFTYEVDALDEADADEQGWEWEKYSSYADVVEINVTLIPEDDEMTAEEAEKEN
jgi:hypothetical protein